MMPESNAGSTGSRRYASGSVFNGLRVSVLFPADRGDQNDRYVLGRRALPKLATHLKPTDIRQPNVQQDQVGLYLGGKSMRFLTCARFEQLKASRGEHVIPGVAVYITVVHRKNTHCSSPIPGDGMRRTQAAVSS